MQLALIRHAQPFARRQPCRHGRAIVMGQPGQGLTAQHDLAAFGRQRLANGIGAEPGKIGVMAFQRHLGKALLPEGIELGHLVALRGVRGAGLVIQVPQPAHFVAALVKGIAHPQPLRQRAEDVEIRPRLPDRGNRLLHRHHQIRPAVSGNVVALQRGRGRQHDIGPPRSGGEHRILHHDGFGPGPGLGQAVQILMVMIGVAARPIDHPHIGIAAGLPLIGELRAGVLQHVGNPGNRDETVVRLDPLRDRGRTSGVQMHPHPAQTAIAIADPAPRQADLPGQRRQSQRRPIGLFAMAGALQAPAQGHHGAGVNHGGGQIADAIRRNAADRRGPVGGFHRPIRLAAQIGQPLVRPAGAAVQKRPVLAPGAQDFAGHAQQQRGIGVRPDRPPLAGHPVRQIVAQGRDQDHPHPAVGDLAQIAFQPMGADPACLGLRGARGQRTKHHQRPGMLDDTVQRIGIAPAGRIIAQHMAQDHRPRGNRIGVHMAGIAAHQIEHPLEQRGRMMEPPAGCPAIAAREDGIVAMIARHAADLPGHHVQRLVPGHGHKGLVPPAPPVAAPRQPTLAHHRAQHAPVRPRPVGHRLDHRRRRGVLRQGLDTDNPAILDQNSIAAPMAGMWNAADHRRLSQMTASIRNGPRPAQAARNRSSKASAVSARAASTPMPSAICTQFRVGLSRSSILRAFSPG